MESPGTISIVTTLYRSNSHKKPIAFEDATILRPGIVANTYNTQDGMYAGIKSFPIWKRMSSSHHKTNKESKNPRQVNTQ